jgi:hypothetical protein
VLCQALQSFLVITLHSNIFVTFGLPILPLLSNISITFQYCCYVQILPLPSIIASFYYCHYFPLLPLLSIIAVTFHYCHYFPLLTLLSIIGITFHYCRYFPLFALLSIIAVTFHYWHYFPAVAFSVKPWLSGTIIPVAPFLRTAINTFRQNHHFAVIPYFFWIFDFVLLATEKHPSNLRSQFKAVFNSEKAFSPWKWLNQKTNGTSESAPQELSNELSCQ